MRILAITTPRVEEDDVRLIRGLIRCGIDTLHLRKPDATVDDCRSLLQELTEHERKRIIVHDYPELYDEFSLKGIHLNGTVRCLPEGYTGSRTRSCHTLEEVIRYKDACDYVFLSPIFDSISKVGYKTGFSKEELQEASAQGIIDEKVVALGGVTFDSIPYLKHLGFGGVAMIGALYNAKALEYLTLSGLNSIRFPCP